MQHPDFKIPELPLKNLNYEKIMDSVVLANRELWKYDGLIQNIPNPEILLWTFATTESLSSSRIEGTQASISEVIKYQDSLKETDKNFADIQEVVNYKKALLFAIEKVKKEDLSLLLLKETHWILLNWVRWSDRERWQFRTKQNRIWTRDSTPETAAYLPPAPEEMDKYLKNLEEYFKYDDRDPLVQVAIIHSQFESIHPFLDWNWRIWRLLIPLFLYKKWLLSYPSFYMSEYFEYDKYSYILALRKVTHELDWEWWIEYFMYAIVAQVHHNTQRINDMQKLYDSMKSSFYTVIHSPQYIKILDFLFKKPIFTALEFSEKTWISKSMCYSYLDKLVKEWFLSVEWDSQTKTYTFKLLMDIIES